MQKKILFLLLCGFTCMPSFAGNGSGIPVRVSDLNFRIQKDSVKMSFRIRADRRAVRSGQYVVIVPRLMKDSFTWSFPAIIVQGRLAGISRARHIALSKQTVPPALFYLRNNDAQRYSVTVPYQRWMEGAELSLEAVKITPCSEGDPSGQTIAENLIILPVEVRTAPVSVAKRSEPEVRDTVPDAAGLFAEELMREYPYMAFYNRQEFTEMTDGRILYADDMQCAAAIYFPQAYQITPDYRDNGRVLSEVAAALAKLRESRDFMLKSIVVAGFASPDGDFAANDRMAWRRAVSIKRYLMTEFGIPAEKIYLYNGSEDWPGLRMLIEKSELEGKQALLGIFNHTPVADTAGHKLLLHEIKGVANGVPYRYISDHYFPLLRRGGILKIFFEEKQ